MAGGLAPEEWFDGFRASMTVVDHMLFGSMVVDARTGEVIAANPRARELLGGEVPARVQDLVESGALARPDLDILAAEAVGPHPSSWRHEVTLHLPGGRCELTLLGGSIEHPGIDARAVVVLVCERGRERIYVDYEAPREAPLTLQFAWDEHLRVRGVDPLLADFWPTPDLGVGAFHWMGIHPGDLHLAAPVLARLVTEELHRVEYTVRVITPMGNWIPARIEARRLVGGADTPFQVTFSLVGEFKETIGDGQLTQRERVIVASLFDGHRVQHIVERDQVSIKTLRNQLTAIYRKLGVTDLVELLETYHRPLDVPMMGRDLSGWTWPAPRRAGQPPDTSRSRSPGG